MDEMKRDLYQEVGKVCRDFFEKTYHGDIIAKFEISYDGIYWSDVVCFIEYDPGENSILFSYDWWEGEDHIRNIKVCHLEDVIFPEEPKHGRWEVETDCEGKTRRCICNQCGYKTGRYTWKNPKYCENCGARMDLDEVEE